MASDSKKATSPPNNVNLWALGLTAGVKIAAPLVVFVLIGIKLDKNFHTLPLFIIVAFVASFVTSLILLMRDVKRLNQAGNPKI